MSFEYSIAQRADDNMSRRNGWIQFIKFALVGIFNTIISLATYYMLLWWGCHYLMANIVSWAVSVFNAFYWNNKYVFKNNVIWWRALIKTYLSYSASFVLGTACLYLQVELFEISRVLAPVFTLLLTVPMNFTLNKFWTFKSRL